jgi:hypothetical protein
LGQRVERFALALPESRFAFLLEDEWNVHTRTLLDLRIGVIEGSVHQPCKSFPYGGLSRPHRSNQEHVALSEHDGRQNTESPYRARCLADAEDRISGARSAAQGAGAPASAIAARAAMACAAAGLASQRPQT